MVNENFSDHGQGQGVLQRTKGSILGELVYYHHDNRLVTDFWKTHVMECMEMAIHIEARMGNGYNIPKSL